MPASRRIRRPARGFFAKHVLPESELLRLEAEGIVMRADPLGEIPAESARHSEPADTL